ncbi:HAD family hydrolase [Candidatus Roizmanbacteria bacterium]|nr:HAD family hydrolase [Candidatus Roizmanbacteria bacterium]
MKLKAILSDFDGTLVDKQNKYNPKINKLLAKICQHNIRFSLATGRSYYGAVQKVLKELKIFDYHILHAGAMIFNNQSNKILWSQSISKESVSKIVEYFQKNRIYLALETKDSAYIPYRTNIAVYSDNSPIKLTSELKDFSTVLKILLTVSINRMTESQLETHIENLNKLCKDAAVTKIHWDGSYGLDITSEKATKHTAVLEYERLLNIPRSQIVAIGDGYNDYPLFTACGYKIAMENAPKVLKEIADYIVPKVEDEGFIIALEHIISKFISNL